MNIILFDDPEIRKELLPFTFTRPVAEIRIGILTIAEKWRRLLNGEVSFLTEDYLSAKYPTRSINDNLLINGAICPNAVLIDSIKSLKIGEGISEQGVLIAARNSSGLLPEVSKLNIREYQGSVFIDRVWKIFQLNGSQIRSDFKLVTNKRKSQAITDIYTRCYNESEIFLEEGVNIRAAILNAENGPIYLGKDSFVHEGAIIRGPFALGEGSHVNMGAKVRGDTTVGPFSKIGGEVSNSVIFGYSNKAHDGFLGNSVVGEWCNIGADSNTSNLKNNFENIKIWSHPKKSFEDSGLMFCGLMFGDHSKCGINTMFNTGTIAGVCDSIFGEGYPQKYIPSFTWGGGKESSTYRLDKAYEAIAKAMARRDQMLNEVDKKILENVFNQSKEFRLWER